MNRKSRHGHGGSVVVTQPPSNFRPLHESINRRILQSSAGWGTPERDVKIAVMVELFVALHDGRMPADEAKKIAKMYQAVPDDLHKIGKHDEADIVDAALRSLESRVDAPKPAGEPWYVSVVNQILGGLPKSSEPPMEAQTAAAVGNLFRILEKSRPMPPQVARQIADQFKNVPTLLLRAGHATRAAGIEESLKNLASRQD